MIISDSMTTNVTHLIVGQCNVSNDLETIIWFVDWLRCLPALYLPNLYFYRSYSILVILLTVKTMGINR